MRFARSGLPGLALAVVVGDSTWTAAWGVQDVRTGAPVGPDTVFRIGSLTKVFTGLVVLGLRDEGRLSLDEPASRWLPELSGVVYPTRDSPPITLRHLLTHTAGFNLFGWPRIMPHGDDLGAEQPDERTLLGALNGMPLLFAPGTHALYSNLGTALAALAASRAAGAPAEQLVLTRIVGPLGMTSTSFRPPSPPSRVGGRVASGHRRRGDRWVPTDGFVEMRALAPEGALFSSARDMARFLAMNLRAWPPRDDPEEPPMRRATLREAHQSLGEQPGGRQVGAFFTSSKPCGLAGPEVAKNGAVPDGFEAKMAFAPERGVGVVLLANGLDTDVTGATAVDTWADDLVRELADETGPTMPPRVARAVEAIVAWLDDATAADGGSDPPPETSAVTSSSRERAQAALVWREAGGACGGARLLDYGVDGEAEVELRCAKRALEMAIALDPGGRVSALSLRPASCDER